jgi:VWFA-related protein
VHGVLRRLTVGLVAAVLLGAAVSAQQGRFRSGVDLVNVGVMVLDKRGNFITDLNEGDFEVYEDGERQTVKYFARGDTAGHAENLRVGLLFDTSGSMLSVSANVTALRVSSPSV